MLQTRVIRLDEIYVPVKRRKTLDPANKEHAKQAAAIFKQIGALNQAIEKAQLEALHAQSEAVHAHAAGLAK